MVEEHHSQCLKLILRTWVPRVFPTARLRIYWVSLQLLLRFASSRLPESFQVGFITRWGVGFRCFWEGSWCCWTWVGCEWDTSKINIARIGVKKLLIEINSYNWKLIDNFFQSTLNNAESPELVNCPFAYTNLLSLLKMYRNPQTSQNIQNMVSSQVQGVDDESALSCFITPASKEKYTSKIWMCQPTPYDINRAELRKKPSVRKAPDWLVATIKSTKKKRRKVFDPGHS